MGFGGGGLGVSLSVDGGGLGVVDRWLWWFVGFNGGCSSTSPLSLFPSISQSFSL